MPATIKKLGSTAIIRLEGKLNLGAPVEEFRARWSDALATGMRHVIVDVQAVPAVDSAGLGALVRCHSAVRGNGGKMKLVGAGDLVRNALQLSHLDLVFDLHDDEESAVAALGPGV